MFTPGLRRDPSKKRPSPGPCSDRRSPAMLTGRCLAEPSALDGRCTQMVTLQIAEPLCPRDRLVGGVLHPFRHGNAAETADPLEQIPQKHASFMAIRQVSHKRTVDLDGVDRQSLEVLPRGVTGAEIVERHPASGAAQRV